MSAALNALQAFSARRPLLATSVAGFCIASIGDIFCQRGFEGKRDIDWMRTGEMGVIRATVMAPFLFVYFPRLAASFPGTSAFAVARRIVADQLLGSPVAICLVFCASCAIQGRPLEAPTRIQQQLLPTWLNSISYWPFAHILTFKFVPVKHQAHFANFLSVYWNMVLSYRANVKLQPLAEAGAQSPDQGSTTLPSPSGSSTLEDVKSKG